jgi:hypothetical protein
MIPKQLFGTILKKVAYKKSAKKEAGIEKGAKRNEGTGG